MAVVRMQVEDRETAFKQEQGDIRTAENVGLTIREHKKTDLGVNSYNQRQSEQSWKFPQ
jgi:hypothetical protein